MVLFFYVSLVESSQPKPDLQFLCWNKNGLREIGKARIVLVAIKMRLPAVVAVQDFEKKKKESYLNQSKLWTINTKHWSGCFPRTSNKRQEFWQTYQTDQLELFGAHTVQMLCNFSSLLPF